MSGLDYTALRLEIMLDIEDLGYAQFVATGADGGIAELLNARVYPVVGKLAIADLQAWLMNEPIADESGRSIWQAVQDVATGSSSAKRAAQEVLDVVTSRATTVDLAKARPAALLEGYVSAGLITPDQKDEILAMATTMKSRAELLFGAQVQHTDIAIALRGQDND